MLGLALQEQSENNAKTVEAMKDMLNDKFTVYVDIIHHHHFVTKYLLQYAFLKHHMNNVHASGEGSLSIKRETCAASSSHQAYEDALAGNTPENPIRLEEEHI